MTPFRIALVRIAAKEIGVAEVAHTNLGKRVNEYKAATKLNPAQGWAWCAAFVCWCVWQAIQALGVVQNKGFARPTTARAWGMIPWSLAQDSRTHTRMFPKMGEIEPGDIVVYTFSHVGISDSYCDTDGNFTAIEGNTDTSGGREGGSVMRRERNARKVKARIRFKERTLDLAAKAIYIYSITDSGK